MDSQLHQLTLEDDEEATTFVHGHDEKPTIVEYRELTVVGKLLTERVAQYFIVGVVTWQREGLIYRIWEVRSIYFNFSMLLT